ncbi:MAG: AtpZ/AtpI family protein [Elusimicrobia bacterium]|nr:AtpZ/AtpI family protein [Elusimicrobiota bacterium]
MAGKEDNNYWEYAQIGLELAVAVLLGFWAGYKLDQKLGTAPWLMLGGAAFGLASGFYLVAKELFRGAGPDGKGGE